MSSVTAPADSLLLSPLVRFPHLVNPGGGTVFKLRMVFPGSKKSGMEFHFFDAIPRSPASNLKCPK